MAEARRDAAGANRPGIDESPQQPRAVHTAGGHQRRNEPAAPPWRLARNRNAERARAGPVVVTNRTPPGRPALADSRVPLITADTPGLSAPAAGAKRREKPSPPYGDKAAEGGGPALMCFAAGV